jgi:type IV secretory pathway protease TraF
MLNGLSKPLAAAKWSLLAILVVVAFAVVLLPRATGYKWLWVRGPSVNMTLGLLNPGIPRNLKAGEYVLTVWQGSDINGVSKLREGTAIVKRVGCLPGQHLKVTMRQADCDGIKVAHIRHKTMDGMSISPALYDDIIPPGKVFLLGEHYYSYDSR